MPVTTRIADFPGSRASPQFDTGVFEAIAFVVLILLGVGLCFVHQPASRRAAFLQGSSVIGVLFAMNIGTSVVGPAQGESMVLNQEAEITTTAPRAFGPLGVGTLITGRSHSHAQTVEFGSETTVECTALTRIGKDTYCSVPYSAISGQVSGGSDLQNLSPGQEVWIKQMR